VPESLDADLARADIAFQGGDAVWRAARVVRRDGMTDPATRTRTVHVAPRDAPLPEPGAFVRVRVRRAGDATTRGVRVPEAALVRRGGLTGVYVIEAERARLRWIRTGASDEGSVDVLAGLDAGELVARDARTLSDGLLVTLAP
jgi:hypothetical protein